MTRSDKNFTFHPRSRFDAFLEGDLSSSSHSKVRQHLLDCPSCAEEVAQRSRALHVTRTVNHSGQPSAIDTSELQLNPESVLHPEGTPGWKIVMSMGIACALVCGVIFSVWLVGGPANAASSATAQYDKDSPFVPGRLQVSPVETGGGAIPAGNRESNGQLSSEHKTRITDRTAPLGVSGRQVRMDMLQDLRSYSWNIPRLASLGMQLDSAIISHEGSQWAEIATVLSGDAANAESRTVVRECHQLGEDAGVEPCDAPQYAQDASKTLKLPAPHDAVMHVYDDRSWSAFMITDHAYYRVDSDSDPDQATSIMTRLAVSDNARLSSGEIPDTSVDRFQRGLNKIFGAQLVALR